MHGLNKTEWVSECCIIVSESHWKRNENGRRKKSHVLREYLYSQKNAFPCLTLKAKRMFWIQTSFKWNKLKLDILHHLHNLPSHHTSLSFALSTSHEWIRTSMKLYCMLYAYIVHHGALILYILYQRVKGNAVLLACRGLLITRFTFSLIHYISFLISANFWASWWL